MNDKVAPKLPDPAPLRPAPRSSMRTADNPLSFPSAAGNQFMQSTMTDSHPQCFAEPGRDGTPEFPAPPPREPVKLDIDLVIPGSAYIPDDIDLSDVSRDLYGVDLSAWFEIDDGTWGIGSATGRVRVKLFIELLREPYAQEFHSKMEGELDKDVDYVESKLMETWVDDEDESAILKRVRWWSTAADVRDRVGITYFDRFLARLESERYYTDYVVTSGAKHSFLSLLHEEIEDDAGALVEMIANHSERFGSYRPPTLIPSIQQPGDDRSELLVKRVTNQLLDRLVGFTSASDEQGIVGMMTGMPKDLQARVLLELQTRHAERRFLLNRTGEQDDVGMMYFLFEDLEQEDQRKLGDDLVKKGVFKQEAVDTLIAGRTWAGRNLQWSTKLGAQAAQFWADKYNESDNKATSAVSATLGSFASLWTPETAGTTIVVLVTANPSGVVGRVVGMTPEIVQKGLLVAGTGITAYQGTRATMAAISGTEDGRELSKAERIIKGVEAVSSALMLGAGFMGARKPKISVEPSRPALPAGPSLKALPEPQAQGMLPAKGETTARVGWRVMSDTPEKLTAIGIVEGTEEFAVITVNKASGDISGFSPRTGPVRVENGRLVPESPALGAGNTGIPAEGIIVSPDTTVLPINSPAVPRINASPAASRPMLVGPKAPLALPGEGPAIVPRLPGRPAPLMLGAGVMSEGEDLLQTIQQHIDMEFGPDARSGLQWAVGEDGVAFASPPLPKLPAYFPEGTLPPGEWFQNTALSLRPVGPVLAGPLKPGFTPFEIFPTPAETSRTLNQVRGTRGGNAVRGNTGRDYTAQLQGGETEVMLDLPNAMTRRSDLLSPTMSGTLNQEVKTYLRYLRVNGATVAREVSPSAFLRTEITRDAMIMYYYPDQQPLWVFIDAPPSAALVAELNQARIPYLVFSDRVPLLAP